MDNSQTNLTSDSNMMSDQNSPPVPADSGSSSIGSIPAASQIEALPDNPIETPAVMPDQTPADQPTIDMTPKIVSQPFTESYVKKASPDKKPLVLLIMDGWGIGPDYEGNAILKASTPNMDRYWIQYPHTQLEASGEAVGLPHDVDGNSETGHMSIGAGTIVFQDLPRIDDAIADGSFQENKAFLEAIAHVKANNSTLHLMGLIGSGFVHSNVNHLYALLRLAKKHDLQKVYIHGFTDGRDSPPTVGVSYVQQVQQKCQEIGVGEIVSLMGRFYAMDRDKKWDRIEKAYHSLVLGAGVCVKDPISGLQDQYSRNVTDEFIEPINICDESGNPKTINDNDSVIFFNFRVDRPRELTRAFVMPDFEAGILKEEYDPFYEKYHKTSIMEEATPAPTFHREKVPQNLYFVTMTTYDKAIPTPAAFPTMVIRDNVGRVIAEQGLRQLKITETEKEKMVTYYMNGLREEPYPGEDWIIFPSKGAKSYAEVPEMSAFEIGQKIVEMVEMDRYEVIIANIANPDMCGHTGILEAGVKGCEYADQVAGKIVDAVLAKNGVVLITADHGNVEEMVNMETMDPDTEHSIYPVPFIVIDNEFAGRPQMLPTGVLADIVPTMLHILGLPKPEGMTGNNLFVLKWTSSEIDL
ncbi:MAG: 2,3-bisphosphoglycerate-independent phosphoglycerate mutase [Patescibacteria group bacterium]